MREGWHTVAVEDVARVVGGGTPRSTVPEFWGGDVQWLTPKDLAERPARYTTGGTRTITQAGLERSGAKLLPPGAVLLTSRAPVGYVSVAAGPIATNQGFKSLVLDETQLPEFWYYLLGHSTEYLRANSGGSTFQELSGASLKRLRFTVPPLVEQRRIVDLVGALDDTIAAAERETRALQAALSALCTTWTTPAGDGVPLESVCDILDRHRRPVSESERALRGGDVPYYGANGQVGWIDEVMFDEPLVLLWEDGGPLNEFRERAQAYAIDGPAWVNNHAHVLRATSVPTEWLYYSLRHRDLRLHSSTGTRAKITQAQMRQIPVRVTDGMESMGRVLAQLESALVRAADLSSRLGALRSNLLTSLLSGEHEIPEAYDELIEEVA